MTPEDLGDALGRAPDAGEVEYYGARNHVSFAELNYIVADCRMWAAIAIRHKLPADTAPEDVLLLQMTTGDVPKMAVEVELQRAQRRLKEEADEHAKKTRHIPTGG